MKVTPELEWRYPSKETTAFMTRETIKEVVAAKLFIPVVEELYDNNIFTCWSGLTGCAHIRIPLDGLSKENYLIAQKNCSKNPDNWRVQGPPYSDRADIVPNYSFEIFVDYEERVTDVSEVVDKLLAEIRKFSFQDVQIANPKYAKDSKLPRVDLDGLYKRSEVFIFDIKQQKEIFVPAESFEELSEVFLEGDAPRYFYDEETDTYFENKELIGKSKEFREYENSSEKRKERAIKDIRKRINDDMSDEQKYKTIFDWMVNYFKYDYIALYNTQAHNLAAEAYQKYRKVIMQCIGMIEGYTDLDDIDKAKALIQLCKENKEYAELVSLKQKEIDCRIKEKKAIEEDKEHKHGDLYITRYGICNDFAKEYKELCSVFDLPCEVVRGQILSNGIECGHAWNVVMINGKLKHIDISGAIHCNDGTDQENIVYNFFLKTFSELTAIDKGKNRKISDDSEKEIKSFINNLDGFDFRE